MTKTRHEGAPHVGASLFFEGRKARFPLIFSAIPRGSFFLIFGALLSANQHDTLDTNINNYISIY